MKQLSLKVAREPNRRVKHLLTATSIISLSRKPVPRLYLRYNLRLRQVFAARHFEVRPENTIQQPTVNFDRRTLREYFRIPNNMEQTEVEKELGRFRQEWQEEITGEVDKHKENRPKANEPRLKIRRQENRRQENRR